MWYCEKCEKGFRSKKEAALHESACPGRKQPIANLVLMGIIIVNAIALVFRMEVTLPSITVILVIHYLLFRFVYMQKEWIYIIFMCIFGISILFNTLKYGIDYLYGSLLAIVIILICYSVLFQVNPKRYSFRML